MKRFNLNEGELNCMIILERIKTKELTQEEAAVLLKISLRQLIRKKNRYELEGPNGLKHKGRGKPSNRATDTGVVAEIMKLMENKYLLLKEKAGPTFLADQSSHLNYIHGDLLTLEARVTFLMSLKGDISIESQHNSIKLRSFISCYSCNNAYRCLNVRKTPKMRLLRR